MRYKMGGFFMVSLLFCVLFFCSQTDTTEGKAKEGDKVKPIRVSEDSINVYWDPPDSGSNGGNFAFYELYYRTVDQTGWTRLYEGIPSTDSPHVVVYNKDLVGSGNEFYFAVKGVMADSAKSSLHASFDSTAGPFPWYVRWVK